MVLIFFACVIVAIAMTAVIRSYTPRSPRSPPAKTDVAGTPADSVLPTEDEEPPPPYETPAPATVTTLENLTEKRSSAHLFVIGTCALVPALTAIFLLV